MSLRKINNSDTEFEFDNAEYDVFLVEVKITKEGIKLDEDLLTWEQISKARESLNLVSFTDEEFEAWASKNNYILITKGSCENDQCPYESQLVDEEGNDENEER